MTADSLGRNDISPLKTYKKIMTSIEFMDKYSEDPDIFNPDSDKFKNFLIQSFCFLYPDFHYLSFLSKEDVDLEIIKAASILQILPAHTKKISKLFESMSKDDIHKFWLKFFSLFNRRNDFSVDSLYSISWENKISFFNDMTSTLSYLNYEFPVVNLKKLNCVNVDKEIENWKDQPLSTQVILDESESLSNDEDQAIHIDIDKLTIDLKQVASMYCNEKYINQPNKADNIEFFINFINLTKNILQYKKNLSIIDSKFLKEFNFKMFSNDENLSDSLYFIKRCNNFVKTIRSKIKTLY